MADEYKTPQDISVHTLPKDQGTNILRIDTFPRINPTIYQKSKLAYDLQIRFQSLRGLRTERLAEAPKMTHILFDALSILDELMSEIAFELDGNYSEFEERAMTLHGVISYLLGESVDWPDEDQLVEKYEAMRRKYE